MHSIIKVSLRLAMVVSLLVVGWFRLPHFQLWALIASGRFNSAKPVTVIDFVPSGPDQDMRPVRLGALSLNVPQAALTDEAVEHLQQGILRTTFNDLCFWAVEPRPGWLPPFQYMLDPEYRASFRDEVEVEVEVAAYTADMRSLSMGMSRWRVIELSELMEVRQCLCMCVDHIEILQRPGIKGVLVVEAAFDGRTQMFLDYRASDSDLSGMVGFCMPEGSVSAMAMARAIVSSIKIASAGGPEESEMTRSEAKDAQHLK